MLEPTDVHQSQDCLLKTTHVISTSKDPSSLIECVGLGGFIRVISADFRRRQVLKEHMFMVFIFLALLTYYPYDNVNAKAYHPTSMQYH